MGIPTAVSAGNYYIDVDADTLGLIKNSTEDDGNASSDFAGFVILTGMIG